MSGVKGSLSEADLKVVGPALGRVIERMRERIRATADPDPVSQDMLIAVTGELEKHAWMFQAENI